MTYYPTLDEDLACAKEILHRGKAFVPPRIIEEIGPELSQRLTEIAGGTIYGADIFAAYKLLESFVAEIDDYQRSAALYHRASMALMEAYKRAHSEVPEHVWPDAARVNEWAAKEIETRLTWLDAQQLKDEILAYHALLDDTGAWDLYRGSADVQHFIADLRCRFEAISSQVAARHQNRSHP